MTNKTIDIRLMGASIPEMNALTQRISRVAHIARASDYYPCNAERDKGKFRRYLKVTIIEGSTQ